MQRWADPVEPDLAKREVYDHLKMKWRRAYDAQLALSEHADRHPLSEPGA
jgi:hypothetical protein